MEVFLAAHLKGDPARIGNPAMILGQTLCQEFIMDRAREWYVHDSAGVHMADFRTSQCGILDRQNDAGELRCSAIPTLVFRIASSTSCQRLPQPVFWMTGIRRAILSE